MDAPGILLDDFAGRWQIGRRIDDHHGGQVGHFTGHAEIDVRDRAARYAETGTLILGEGTPMRADRTYLWRQDGAVITVQFEDGRPFHTFRTDADAARALHHCGADIYRVRYDFAAWPAWQAQWTVTGPNKNYVMTSDYARAD